jgi:NitT/TauT family transport system substrate-binding protein
MLAVRPYGAWCPIYRWFPVLGLSVAAVLGLGAAGCSRASRPEGELPRVPVRIGIQDNAASMLVVVASQAGYFADEGLNADIAPYASGKLALESMLAGTVDFATASDLPIVAHSLVRKDYRLLATIATATMPAWLLGRRDRGIATPADLRGKRIGTQPMSAVHYFLSVFLVHHRMEATAVEVVGFPPEALAAAVVDGRVDAICMREPYMGVARTALGSNGVEFAAAGVYEQTFNVVGRQDYLSTHVDVGEAMVRALVRAQALCRDSPPEALALAVRGFGEDRRGEINADWSRYRYQVSLHQSVLLTLEEQARWCRRQSGERVEIPNYLTFLDLRPMTRVVPEAVTIIQ